MTPPTTTPNLKDAKRVSAPGPTSPAVDVSSSRLRSSSVGIKAPQPSKTLLSKCPCQNSNEKSWKMKCSSCRQVWHASCCQIVSKNLTDKIVLEIEKEWICPWCFTPPFLRPANHPSIQNESKLFGAVVAGAINDRITETVEDCIDAKISGMQQSIDAHVTQAVQSQMQKISTQIEDFQSKVAISSIANSDQPSAIHNPNTSEEPLTLTNPTNHIEDYAENFLNEEEVQQTLEALSGLRYSKANGREISSFGDKYTYTGAPSTNSKEVPAFLKNLIEKINTKEEYQNLGLNQVIVNKYTGNNSFLPEHSDNESSLKPQSRIITLSVGSKRNVVFRDKCSQREEVLAVASGSLYAMAQESQHYWTHRIEKEDTVDAARFSITFRTVGSQYKNATLIMGDSNTKYLKFGSGQQKEIGTFGFHFPGQRVEAFHIRDISPDKCIGYQNVLLHCGINDIRDKSPGRLSNDAEPTDIDAHFALLTQKIQEIKSLCPYTSVFVSPILPTKNLKLNKRVVQFNSLLFDFLATNDISDGVRCLNFEEFVDQNSNTLREDLGTWDSENSCPNKKDILHLGKNGIRLLAKLVKQSVLHKFITKRSYKNVVRHNLGGP